MSDWAQIVIQIDTLNPIECVDRAGQVTAWLRRERIIAPFDQSMPGWREDFGRTDWSPGSAWRDAVDEVPGAVFESLRHNGVDIRPQPLSEAVSRQRARLTAQHVG